jgi:hypothetical protein
VPELIRTISSHLVMPLSAAEAGRIWWCAYALAMVRVLMVGDINSGLGLVIVMGAGIPLSFARTIDEVQRRERQVREWLGDRGIELE